MSSLIKNLEERSTSQGRAGLPPLALPESAAPAQFADLRSVEALPDAVHSQAPLSIKSLPIHSRQVRAAQSKTLVVNDAGTGKFAIRARANEETVSPARDYLSDLLRNATVRAHASAAASGR